jgi:hypothetical protein
MKLHSSTIRELIRIFEIHGGHKENSVVSKIMSELDLSLYNQNSTGKDVIVLTEELKNSKNR